MTIPIPYADQQGGLHAIAAEQIGSNIAFDSVPNVNGAPVSSGNPMPVSLLDAAGHAASVTPDGTLNMTPIGTDLFYEGFDLAGTFDATNKWAAGVGTGGGVGIAVAASGGSATLGTGTTASGYAYVQTAASFTPAPPGFLTLRLVLGLPNSVPMNAYAFWGRGIPAASPAASAPIANGIGFEITTAGVLCAVSYAAGSRSQFAVLRLPSDGAYHEYVLVYRPDNFWFTQDGVVVYSQPTNANGPNVKSLPILIAAIAGPTAPASSLTLTIAEVALGDLGRNASQIADGTFPWRKATVTSGGALAVAGSVNTVTSAAATTNLAGSISAGGSFQQIAASNTSRKSLTVKNPLTATEPLYVFLGSTVSATAATSIDLGPGDSYARTSGVVPSDAVQVMAATTSHPFYADAQ
jgi:hypothetical protein